MTAPDARAVSAYDTAAAAVIVAHLAAPSWEGLRSVKIAELRALALIEDIQTRRPDLTPDVRCARTVAVLDALRRVRDAHTVNTAEEAKR